MLTTENTENTEKYFSKCVSVFFVLSVVKLFYRQECRRVGISRTKLSDFAGVAPMAEIDKNAHVFVQNRPESRRRVRCSYWRLSCTTHMQPVCFFSWRNRWEPIPHKGWR